MLSMLSRFARDERASTTVEFGLIGGIIMIGLIGAFSSLRGNLQMTFSAGSGMKPLH